MEDFYIIQSGHNYLYLSTAQYPGDGPVWNSEQYMRPFFTAEQAQREIDDMHPEYRERLKPEVLRAHWHYDPKYEAEVLAVQGV